MPCDLFEEAASMPKTENYKLKTKNTQR